MPETFVSFRHFEHAFEKTNACVAALTEFGIAHTHTLLC